MAFNSKDFSVMAYANGFTLWNYTSADALSSIKDDGYFDDTAPFVRKGDMILTVANNESTIEGTILCVGSVSNSGVSVSDMIAVTAKQETPAVS